MHWSKRSGTSTVARVFDTALVLLALMASGCRTGTEWRREERECELIASLASEDAAERLFAARELSKMKAIRAVPHLLEIVRNDTRESILLVDPGEGMDEFYECTPFAHAICRIGEKGLPIIHQAWQEVNEETLDKEVGRYQSILSMTPSVVRGNLRVVEVGYGQSNRPVREKLPLRTWR